MADPKAMKEMAKAAGMDMPDINPEMKAQAAEQMGNLTPEQMQKMVKFASVAQKCMSVCAKPMAAVKWAISWIPAEFRRSVLMGAAAVFVYWLFMGGSSAATGGAPGPSPSDYTDDLDADEDACDPNPCMNDGVCTVPDDDPASYECTCRGEWEGSRCQVDGFFGE